MKLFYVVLFMLISKIGLPSPHPILVPRDEIIPVFFQEQLEAQRFLFKTSGDIYDPSIPDVVDLRWLDTEVQTQNAPTCTAFALIACMENLLKGKVKLSENHLWSMYKQYQPAPAINAASNNSITLEQYWKITKSKPLENYLKFATYYLKSSHFIADKIPLALKALAKGSVVYLAFFVTQDIIECKIKPDKSSPLADGGHAVAVVGYNQLERTLLIKNSWGADCGESGYQYIPYETCTKTKMYCLIWTIDEVGEKELPTSFSLSR